MINHNVDDKNQTILSLFPLLPHRKIWLGTHSETRERKAILARLVPYGCKGSSPSRHPDLISYLK
ncbi:ABC-type microcin C transport system permease subunit YejE [Kroppenstedtia sanguinis]